MKKMRKTSKKKTRRLKVWGSQAHLRQMRQARDAKQALNGRQPIHLFSVISISVILHSIPSNNFFLLLFANSRLGLLFLHELHNLSFSKKFGLVSDNYSNH